MDEPAAVPSDAPGMPTLVADRYELLGVLGRGGMADVYEALDRTLDRRVALKMLREDAGDASDRARFVNEARTLAGLSHSGLVMVLDAGFDAGYAAAVAAGTDGGESPLPGVERPFLVMELVPGPTLAGAMADGPLPPAHAASVGAQVAVALAYVHTRGVVHRDVKPGNVLLGTDARVKLADFGVARLLGETARHTRTGHAIGTAAYLAPEQVTGAEVSGATDVYSLGLVLLEALTGEREFPGTATEAAMARLHRAPRIPDDLPGAWPDLLHRMTAMDPARRPSSDEVAAVLRAEAHAPVPSADEQPRDTRTVPLLADAPVETTRTERLSPDEQPDPEQPAERPATDRAGDALARQPRVLLERLRSLEPHQVGVLGALGAILALLLVTALVAGPDGTPTEVPNNTPPGLEQPLRDLHDAVEGEG